MAGDTGVTKPIMADELTARMIEALEETVRSTCAKWIRDGARPPSLRIEPERIEDANPIMSLYLRVTGDGSITGTFGMKKVGETGWSVQGADAARKRPATITTTGTLPDTVVSSVVGADAGDLFGLPIFAGLVVTGAENRKLIPLSGGDVVPSLTVEVESPVRALAIDSDNPG